MENEFDEEYDPSEEELQEEVIEESRNSFSESESYGDELEKV